MQQYLFQDGILIVTKVYGNKMPGTMLVMCAVIGMGGQLVLQLGQLALHLMEWDALSWILETVGLVEVLLMLPWMELSLQQHVQTLLA